MARYIVPTIFYQSNLDVNSSVEVPYIKSLSWANKTNNNGNFELVTPMFGLNDFLPMLGGFIRLSPGDTVMQIEKIEKQCDRQNNFWYKMGGRPRQQTDEVARIAKNNNEFFRYVYNGLNAEEYRTYKAGTPVATINSRDLLESSTYEDNLGGFTEIVEDTTHEAKVWGTIITGAERPIVNRVNTFLELAEFSFNGWVSVRLPYATDVLSTSSGIFPRIVWGNENNLETQWDRIFYSGSWIKSDITTQIFLQGPVQNMGGFTWTPGGFANQRTITLYSQNEYEGFMGNLMPHNPYGSSPAVVNRTVTHVEGGHAGYAFTIKAKGDVETRYNVDYKLGDTVSVNDTRLGLVYTGVVSGATETIDSSGYNVDIEVGVMGATVEQRLNRVI